MDLWFVFIFFHLFSYRISIPQRWLKFS
jgi:hypothetical protein